MVKFGPDIEAQASAFEQQTLLPLLTAIRAEPCRQEPVLAPGDLAFCLRHDQPFRVDDMPQWQALAVRYRDSNGRLGDAFSLQCRHDRHVRLAFAEIHDVMVLKLEHNVAVWRNPIGGARFITFTKDDPDKVMLNSWYLFRSTVLPMLYRKTYRFSTTHQEAVVLQQQVLHQMREAWVRHEGSDQS